jgi:hypothetical protein
MIGGNPTAKRSETDFYPTPPEVTEALLRAVGFREPAVIWEPACGEMDMVSVLQSAGHSVIATDLKYGQDFLTMPLPECDWIITNPPFSVSDKFIERCMEHGKPFALLLKSQYWHAKKRYDLFLNAPPYLCVTANMAARFSVQEARKTKRTADGRYVVRVDSRQPWYTVFSAEQARRWTF